MVNEVESIKRNQLSGIEDSRVAISSQYRRNYLQCDQCINFKGHRCEFGITVLKSGESVACDFFTDEPNAYW